MFLQNTFDTNFNHSIMRDQRGNVHKDITKQNHQSTSKLKGRSKNEFSRHMQNAMASISSSLLHPVRLSSASFFFSNLQQDAFYNIEKQNEKLLSNSFLSEEQNFQNHSDELVRQKIDKEKRAQERFHENEKQTRKVNQNEEAISQGISQDRIDERYNSIEGKDVDKDNAEKNGKNIQEKLSLSAKEEQDSLQLKQQIERQIQKHFPLMKNEESQNKEFLLALKRLGHFITDNGIGKDKAKVTIEEILQIEGKEGKEGNVISAKEKEDFVRVFFNRDKWNIQRMRQKMGEEGSVNSFGHKNIDQLKESKYTEAGKEDRGDSAQREGVVREQNRDAAVLLGKNLVERTSSSRTFGAELSKNQNNRDTKQLYDQLVQKAKVKLRNNGSASASINLRPHRLGRITLNIDTFQKQVQAKIIVESQGAKQLLMNELHNFKEELQRQSIQVDSLVVRVRDNLQTQFSVGGFSSDEFSSDGMDTTEDELGDQSKRGNQGDRQEGNNRKMNGEWADTRDFYSQKFKKEDDLKKGEQEHRTSVLQSLAEEYEVREVEDLTPSDFVSAHFQSIDVSA